MNTAIYLLHDHFSNVRNTLSKQLAMVQDSFSGHVNNVLTENGSDSMTKSSLQSELSISTKCTSEPNTTTILTVLTHPQSTETSSSTTTPTISSEKTTDGSTNEKPSTLSRQSTSRSRPGRKATGPVLLSSE